MVMEGDDAGRGTTVPFLVALRFVLAMAVGATTFVVIVLVIAMVRRPEEVQLAIDRGYITLYQTLRTTNLSSVDSSDVENEYDYEDYGFFNVGVGQQAPAPVPSPTSHVVLPLTVSLTASYSSRRGDQNGINCTNITVGLVHMTLSARSWAWGQLPADIKDSVVVGFPVANFVLLPDTSHTEKTMVIITDSDETNFMKQIKDEYVSLVLVMVHIVTREAAPLPSSPSADPPTANAPQKDHVNNGKRKNDDEYTFYCWPVVVGNGYRDLQATDDVQCKKIGKSQVPRQHWATVIR